MTNIAFGSIITDTRIHRALNFVAGGGWVKRSAYPIWNRAASFLDA